jgi:uroporphyrin-III C-methyltransferase
MMKKKGKVFICGAGPGDPGLVTVRAMELLKMCNIILYDRLVGKEIINQIPAKAEKVFVGRTVGDPTTHQDRTNKLMVQHAKKGKTVLRLKGGDPFIFGRGGEELEALAEAGLKFQVVPGVSAAEGCAAYAGIPLTLRGVAQAVLLTTGHTRDDGTPAIGDYQPGQTLALYMGVAQYAELAEALIAKGYARATPVAVVESGTTDRQRVVRAELGQLAAAQRALEIQPPALLIVGETTRYAERFSWFAPSKIERFADESANEDPRVSYRQNSNKAAP